MDVRTQYSAAYARNSAASSSAAGRDKGETFASDVQTGNSASTTGQATATSAPPATPQVYLEGKPVEGVSISRLKEFNIADLSEDEYNNEMRLRENLIDIFKGMLEHAYSETSVPDYSSDPRLKAWGTLVVGGQSVTFDNQGVAMTMDEELGKRISSLLDAIDKQAPVLSGPAIAQHRAE